MSKAISYSLFKKENQALDFNGYFRGFAICLRMNRLLYPDWTTVLHVDEATYNNFERYFFLLGNIDNIEIVICAEEQLCKSMLWRMKPIFETEGGQWKYSHVICRDVDSPATYREVQAVQYWVDKQTKSAHAITDSESHTIAMLGGMVGFCPNHITAKIGCNTFEAMINLGGGMDFSQKGTDQDFLNHVIYPKVAHHGNDSITQHYFNGHGNTFLSDFHTCNCSPPSGHADNCPNNYPIDLLDEMRESNPTCGHIGCAGGYPPAIERFLRKYSDRFVDLTEAESLFPNIFYWVNDKSLG